MLLVKKAQTNYVRQLAVMMKLQKMLQITFTSSIHVKLGAFGKLALPLQVAALLAYVAIGHDKTTKNEFLHAIALNAVLQLMTAVAKKRKYLLSAAFYHRLLF